MVFAGKERHGVGGWGEARGRCVGRGTRSAGRERPGVGRRELRSRPAADGRPTG